MMTLNSNQKKAITFALLCCVVLIASGILFFTTRANNTNDTRASQTTETTTSAPGKVNSESTTTTAADSTSVSTIQAASTTTNLPSTTNARVTTTVPSFYAMPTAVLADEHINHCVNAQYTFEGFITANKAGTVQWSWIRWDSEPTELSGTLTFTKNALTQSVPNYVLTMNSVGETNGWVALKTTWTNGNKTSTHATFEYDYADVIGIADFVPANFTPQGC